MKCFRWLVLAELLLFAGSFGFAQSAGTGAIAGVVTDQSGAVVPDAAIEITNVATGEMHVIRSTSGGRYTAALLQPGTYDLTVSKSGFKDSKYSHEIVNVSQTEALNIVLAVGESNQTVEVSAANLQLQTQTSSLSSVTSGAMLQGLPLVTRNYVQIIALSPGVNSEVNNAATLGRGISQQSISAAGSSIQDNNFEMNGIQITTFKEVGTSAAAIQSPARMRSRNSMCRLSPTTHPTVGTRAQM